MLVVVFDDETKAYQGSSALKNLDAERSISVHALAVVTKNADGTVTPKQIDGDYPIRTLEGTAIGALVGLLGGPIGVVLGATGGMLVGSTLDLNRADVDADYVDQVSTKLTPGKWVVVADISEEWETPVDTSMATLGGTVFRANRVSIEQEKDAKDEAATKAEIAHLKDEQSKATQENKAKIQNKIDGLNAKLQARQQRARQRYEQRKLETEAKIHALQQKADKSSGENKQKLEARIASLRDWLNQPVSTPWQTQQVQSA